MNKTYGKDNIIQVLHNNLEKWENTDGQFLIHLEHPEFTALCPRSGYPDSGSIIVDYVPDKWIVELKAFKLMINGFRDMPISHESVTNTIANRLYSEINPLGIRVIGDFTRRGGVKTVITTTRGTDFEYPTYLPNKL